MTYQEAADFLGMKVESARRRAQREGWPRQMGNDGKARIGVPGDAVAGSGASGVTDAGDDRPHPGEVEALREALARERERADRSEAQAAAALQGLAEARERAVRLESEAERLRGDLAREQAEAERSVAGRIQAEREREEARIGRATAEAEARGLREALAEARRPFWRRWLG